MISLVIPSFGGNVENIKRTIKSCEGICDETIIISTAFYLDDIGAFHQLTDKVVELDWNFTFKHGFGSMMNQGTSISKNDWLVLLGVAETLAEPLCDIHKTLQGAQACNVFRCNHINDIHTWGRVWRRGGGTAWSGIIHEEISGGVNAGLMFRMQDTEKTPCEDHIRNEANRFIKTLSYNSLYRDLLRTPELLGATDQGWLKFVQGAEESILAFCEDHKEMLDACHKGNLPKFLDLVEASINSGKEASGVNYSPQGQPMSS